MSHFSKLTGWIPRMRMGRPYGWSGLVATWLLAVLASAVAQPAPTFAEVTVHDPSVVREGGTFYVFGSHLASASSTNLRQWTQISTSPSANNPLVPNPQQEFQEAIAWVGGDNAFWAPDVIRLPDGRFAYYYCIGRLDQPRAALGLAFSNQITGPYRHEAILLRSGPGGQPPEAGAVYDARIHPNAVDPSLFYDATGQLWMVYGSYSGGIFILKMDAATGRPLAGQGYGKKLMGGQHARIEGAYILYSPQTQYYYLFVSFGGLGANDGYNIRLGRSRSPDGPYVDAAGKDLTTVAGAVGSLFDDASIAPHGVKLMGNYQFLSVAGEPRSVSRGYRSPGHNSAYYDAETQSYYLVFHTRFVGRGEQHEVRVHQMFVNDADWLVVAPHRYAGERRGPIAGSQVPGTYKLINHGKAITPNVVSSLVVQLQSGNSISGAVTGSWQMTGTAEATITLDGTAYRGVFMRQWDDDQQVWVLGFSGLSADGVAVWLSRVGNQPLAAAPEIVRQPRGVTLGTGSSYALQVEATGADLLYQWTRDGTPVPGATGARLDFSALQPGDAGAYRVRVSNADGELWSNAVNVRVVDPIPTRLANLSVRSRAEGGDRTLIMGFNIVGGSDNSVLVRGLGPRLLPLGVSNALPDPRLRLYDRAEKLLQENDDWPADLTATMAQVGALALDPGSKDAALRAQLGAGLYTVHVQPGDGGSGVALAETYDAGLPSGSRLNNVSARAHVGTGDNVLIAGFVLKGNMTKRILIRGMGPALADFGVAGVLADPQLRLYDEDRVLITQNDNWGGSVALQAVFSEAGAFKPKDLQGKDAALVVTLVPGPYTVHVVGSNQTTGVALVEVYELP